MRCAIYKLTGVCWQLIIVPDWTGSSFVAILDPESGCLRACPNLIKDKLLAARPLALHLTFDSSQGCLVAACARLLAKILSFVCAGE